MAMWLRILSLSPHHSSKSPGPHDEAQQWNPAPLTRTPGLPLTERCPAHVSRHPTGSTHRDSIHSWTTARTMVPLRSSIPPPSHSNINPPSLDHALLPPWKPSPIRANQIRNSRSCLSSKFQAACATRLLFSASLCLLLCPNYRHPALYLAMLQAIIRATANLKLY